jgi:type I restriction enzyme S subunit
VTPNLEKGTYIKSSKLFVPNDAILFSRLNPYIPRVWWARSDHAGGVPVASTEFFVATAKELSSTPWLYCFLSSPEFLETALARVTGTSNSHQRVTPTALAEIEVATAKAEVTFAFGSMTGPWFEQMHAKKAENQTLAALRDALLPRLMSGELRVGAARELVEEVV